MRRVRDSTARRLFLCILSFNVCLMICLLLSIVFVWTSTVRTATRDEPEHPLICIFTTFKPDIAKIPIYLNTLRNWQAIDSHGDVKSILYVANNNSMHCHLATFARDHGWTVFKAPRVSSSGLPYLKEMYHHASQHFNTCIFYGYSNGDILYNRDLVVTLSAISKKLPDLNRTMVIGRRTNVLLGNDSLLYLPENVTQAATDRGQLFQENAEDYFFIAFNDFPWHRVVDVVVGRTAYDNYLVGTAIDANVTVVDATSTLLAVHQSDVEGNFAGHRSEDYKFNAKRIGKFNYMCGITTKAQSVTRFTDGGVYNGTKVVVERRRPAKV